MLEVRAETSTREIKKVKGEFVEPVQLQVICLAFWRKSTAAGGLELSEQELQEYGDTADQALAKLYEDCIRLVARSETAEYDLRRWFDMLITPQGTRGMVFRAVGSADEPTDGDIDKIEDWHVIHTEWRGGGRWCQLSHDRQIGPIQNANRQWMKRWEAGQSGERLRAREFLEEAAAVLAQAQRLAREASPDGYRFILDAALKWQVVFSSFTKGPPRMPIWPMPSKTEVQSEEDLPNWFKERARMHWRVRKLYALLRRPDQSIEGLFGMLPSTDLEMVQDWITAALIFAMEVLAGEIHLTRTLRPRSYGNLEGEWLSDVKRTKAYLMWERCVLEQQRDRQAWSPDDFYFEVCKQLRERLAPGKDKAEPVDFAPIRDYLREHYLDAVDKLAPHREDSDRLLRAKAHQIFAAGAGQGADADWYHACAYARMFYDNIIPAVEAKSQEERAETTLLVLKAFQYSKAPENRYLIINCFEAAVAIYFLDAEIVQRIWDEARDADLQASYTVSTVEAAGWCDDWIPPGELRERLRFDSPSATLVLHGVLREAEKQALLDRLPEHESRHETTILKLFKRSRLLPKETTI
jgi:hypothetical protein